MSEEDGNTDEERKREKGRKMVNTGEFAVEEGNKGEEEDGNADEEWN